MQLLSTPFEHTHSLEGAALQWGWLQTCLLYTLWFCGYTMKWEFYSCWFFIGVLLANPSISSVINDTGAD